MKDKTHSMNMEHGGEGAVSGFTRVGSPTTSRQDKMAKLKKNCLFDELQDECVNEAAEMGNPGDSEWGGFLPRNNTGDRF